MESRGGLPTTHTPPQDRGPRADRLRWASALRTYPRRQRSQTTPRLPLHTVYAKGSERKSSSPGRRGAKARSPFPRSAVLNFSTFSGSILFTVSARQTPAASRSCLASRGQPERAPAPCARTSAEGRGGRGGASAHAQAWSGGERGGSGACGTGPTPPGSLGR